MDRKDKKITRKLDSNFRVKLRLFELVNPHYHEEMNC
jgi:hypothetical protein